jgi:hypothetical protein
LAPMERWKTEAGAVAMEYQRWTRHGCKRDVEVASFYSHVLCRRNAGLLMEGEREVTAQRGGRVIRVHVRGEMGQLSTA